MIKTLVAKMRSLKRIILNRLQLSQIAKNLVADSVGQKRIFLFQTPTHSNIGDHAIAAAEIDFFKHYYSDYKLIEINQSQMINFVKKYRALIKQEDIVTLHGGGNFGNEYMAEEKLRRFLVGNFPDNKIVVLPQTIYYFNNDEGQRELKITQDIFSKHPKLTLTARESISYELMKEYFPNNNVILTPDIVLFTSQILSQKRSYGLEVIRQDQESILSEEDKKEVKKLLTSNFKQVISSDMHVKDFRSINTVNERAQILEGKFKQFRSAKIAITDRLHGMVFAAITGTPCIVFSNYNQKVTGTYDWIKDLKYIKFVKNVEEAKLAFDELIQLEDYQMYDNSKLLEKYNPLKQAIDE
ncbi:MULTISPECIES: polysaccharide pyruvyl transferase family protein [unclassified Sphingobacterium]|uniref:polysaccharide pyruvyl transferase family protein n=1 Tax=unclassified Sphingobacterium TaxID=2609468 RepID=UPI0025D67817|nr:MULTISPECIES: polysaccharide pyruvyl transferase family protein [unclassified Sphingobacterium]